MDISDLVEITTKEISKDTIIITPKCFLWCKLPYEGHKQGCPNYGKSECPPYTKLFNPAPYHKFLLVYAEFDFKTYKQEMKKLHPEWTEKQCGNLLYWQGSIKKMLKDYIREKNKSGMYVLGCGSGFSLEFQREVPSMEAVGIYVYGTLMKNGMDFEIKPKNKVVLVCLLCLKKTITIDNYITKK